MQPNRLQLGTSRLEFLPAHALRIFLDKSWMHFGDAPYEASALRQLVRRVRQFRRGICDPQELYAKTNFKVFYYRKGELLPFDDESMHFIFSEHFFEHLFFDDALALFRECHRILARRGVLRVSVPDADLRTYDAPEPIGYPSRSMPFTDPTKHKTRWSVYMLTEALALCGFSTHALRYCDRDGKYVQNKPEQYKDCPETTMVCDLSYLFRPDSLIVDGVKGESARVSHA